jgi:LuxR family transcriptional regulator, maltose regulon positive regulatory protein
VTVGQGATSRGRHVAASMMTGRRALRGARFALAKFRPTTLPDTLVARPVLHEQLTGGASQRLTVVVGSAGAGKSVLLSSWVASRRRGATSWLSCDGADVDPARFWAGFIEAPRVMVPDFGTDAADLLAMDGTVSADVTASIANDAAKLPAGSAVIVDDFHAAAAAAGPSMTDLVERWPAGTAQLVLASRSDPPLRLHRLRMSGELCEIRDHDLYFSLAESRDLLVNFGVQVTADELALLHQRSEGWAAALQMVAMALRGSTDPARVARALDIRSHTFAEYFISEVLDQQTPEMVQFMLDTSILGPLSAGACAAVTGRHDAAALLRSLDAANLFIVALDDERTTFRYHLLVRQVLRTELRTRCPGREQELRLRAAEWYESAGETRRAARYYFHARETDRALALLRARVVPDFMSNPAVPAALDLSMINPSLLADAPDRLLSLATDLLLSGDMARGGEYLDLLERTQPPIPADSVIAAGYLTMRSFQHALTGRLSEAVGEALAGRATRERTRLPDQWSVGLPLILMRIYNCLEDRPAVEREAATALGMPELGEPARLVMVPGAQALARFEYGDLAGAVDAASAAEADARRLGFDQHFFAVDYLRTCAGLALERRDLDAAERLTERVLSITERRRPIFEFLARLDRARIWAARGHAREALATVEAARTVLAGTRSVLLARADEREALLRLSLLDLRTPVELVGRLPSARRDLLLARVALAAGNHVAAQEHLHSPSLGDLTPRQALVRQVLLVATAIERGDPMAAGVLAGALEMARDGGFLDTVVTTAPQVTGYLIEHSAQVRRDPFTEMLISAALEAHATQPTTASSRQVLADPLTAAELRILKLLPTSTYLQMADALYISRNTVKTHLRSIYQKLGVASRPQALERAVELRLL